MNLAPQHIEAQPAPSGGRKVGDIWREGSRFYEQLSGGIDELHTFVTFIEREDRCELLRFGARRICPYPMCSPERMPLISCDGATPAEVTEARLMCFDEERYSIKRALEFDDPEWEAAVRGEQC